jgi:hypothetical protein
MLRQLPFNLMDAHAELFLRESSSRINVRFSKTFALPKHLSALAWYQVKGPARHISDMERKS